MGFFLHANGAGLCWLAQSVSWSTPLMKHVHEIRACILLLMFSLYMYKEVGRGRKNREIFQDTRRERDAALLSCVYIRLLYP